MLQYIVRRLATSFVVVILLMVFLAVLPHLISGDIVSVILGPRANPELAATVRAEMGLDKSIPTQVWDFVINALQGNLGSDIITHLPVIDLIGHVLPNTVILAVSSLFLSLLVALPLGVVAAARPDGWADRLIGVISISFITIPPYVVGLFLLIIFTVKLHLLPALGTGDLSHPLDYAEHLILPATALALSWMGYFTRLIRSSMLEVLTANHIRTAQALGLRPRVVYGYAVKNAIIPTVAVLGFGLGALMSSAVFVEAIFTRSGLGTLVLNALLQRNYTVVRGGVLVIALFVIFSNLLADICYRFLDPRVRVGGGR
jgi:peptide/nickel transport system permease protein